VLCRVKHPAKIVILDGETLDVLPKPSITPPPSLPCPTGSVRCHSELAHSFPGRLMSLLPVEHRLTALLQFFSLLAHVVRDLAGFDADLRHRTFHGFGRLLAQFVA
jgi:hypothetical protein